MQINHFRTGHKTTLTEGGHAECWMEYPREYVGFVRGGELITLPRQAVNRNGGKPFVEHKGERIPVNGF